MIDNEKEKAAFHIFLNSINNYRALVHQSEVLVSKNVMTFKWMMLLLRRSVHFHTSISYTTVPCLSLTCIDESVIISSVVVARGVFK